MHLRLSINGRERLVVTSEEVAQLLHARSHEQFIEVWLTGDPSEPSLSLLANGDHAWLMYLRESGDSGYSSRNPDYSGREEATIDYLFSNGQRDRYPASWAIPRSRAIEAAVFFAADKGRPPWVEWHED